ncbi:uncharacterized protein OCT59_012668 [Rhizophagus irregularis]|uniref:F-box domain-containing protein n=4 Tax=Rhizophagus irregularis TaxID=588596 RepID=A0A015MDD6_RHIIW|nr:hypothetical protein RirG_139060 [Rhizophagus irregularis DAOM 197198w]UZO20242.1 hypothetical protein OCT59_012668 [Rhizophagus irregularis]CAG8681060.1 18226_t:CDS:1 [Rhizophagus irregularis]
MFKLNKDILFLIFEELKDDSKSLFSCLMVNKLWCETIIPILWRNPWCHKINYNNKNYLLAIISFYLSDDTKEFLIKKGIQIPTISSQSLSFDYLSFCRSINIDIINNIISIESSYNQFLLQQEFYRIFIKKCPELKYLDIKSIKHQIFYFPEANIRLESLCELECDTSIDSSYFYGLARFCQYIQRLIIINIDPKENNGISKLIEVQKNLKYFEWNDSFEDSDYFTDDPYKEILLELEKKANIINHLKIFFQYVDNFRYALLQNVLTKLYKLKTLICDFSIFGEQEVKMLVFKDLEILNINYITLNEASNMIENSGGNLKEILLKFYDLYKFDTDFDENSLNFIRKVYKNCPLIEYLSLTFPPLEEHFDEFENLLKNCQYLKSLLLIISDIRIFETYDKTLENGEELLKILVRSAPVNLREIRFFNDFKFSLEALENFLESWKGYALTILTSDTIYEGDDYKNLINKYKNDGVIKDFRCESTANVENIHFKI